MQTTELLTPTETAYMLNITEYTLQALVHHSSIPHTYIPSPITQDRLLRFDPYTLTEWMQANPNVATFTRKPYIDHLKDQYQIMFPHVLASLKDIDAQFSPPRRGKGYNLTKVYSKKYGFLYYVRYIEQGKLVRSRWNTHTNNLSAAECFARENRERILTGYHSRHDVSQHFFTMLSEFYQENSEYMTISANRGRILGEATRKLYHGFITNTLIPYFKTHTIRTFTDITKPVIEELQDYLLNIGRKPQTVGRLISCVRQMFDYFVTHGTIQSNPFRGIVRIRPKKNDIQVRGCYEIDTLKGVFNKKWQDETNLLLCLIIYTTNMRNSEIKRIQVKNIIEANHIHFVDISTSKTENGTRLVPLHPSVYTKLQTYITQNNLHTDDYLFKIGRNTYQKACTDMGRLLKKMPEELAALHITYYSGRKFWKTAMNVENLGDVEEYFMGHKVSADVAKLYNHKDKVGRKNIAAKAKAMFKVLDKYLGLNRTV
jgi:site-specific recombinase XerD